MHLGSRHSLVDRFLDFLDRLPPDTGLVLNGDTADAWRLPLQGVHQRALDRLQEEASRRDVVWILGNNDRRFGMKPPKGIRFVDFIEDGDVFVTHGHQFDHVLHSNLLLTLPFQVMHHLRIMAGAKPIHVAVYARRWSWLYYRLKQHVVRKAVRYAREKGYRTIVCGHLHYAEDTMMDGIRYLNTGSWTEEPIYCVTMGNGRPELCAVNEENFPAGVPAEAGGVLS